MSRRSLFPEDPQRLGEYWLAARLGSGAQGVVFEAYDPAGSRVAVKVLHPEVATGARARTRFAKEVRAAQRVASFCTARVLDADTEAVNPYIVSEFVPGPNLAAAVRTAGPLRGDALVRLATGVVTALAAIHQAGVVHRDLKPSNVLLGPDGPRVIDFGIARTAEMTLTETGAVMGTVGYLAPETLQGRHADAAADVFAWGAVVLYAATGTEPFRGDNLGEAVVRALEHHPDLSALPAPLQPLVRAALAKQPENRPGAAALLLRLLGGDQDTFQALQAGAHAAALGPLAEGTVTPAVGEAAEASYRALSPEVQLAARQIWLRMVVPGSAPDGSHDSVRTVDEDELLAGRSDPEQARVRQVLTAFAHPAVLVHKDATVRPASAAVLRAWPRLRGWADTDRAGLRIHRRLGAAARIWQRGGQRPDDLARGTALHDAVAWAATAPSRLRANRLERAFLQASQEAESRRARRTRRINMVLVGALVLTLVSAALALWQRGTAIDALTAEQRALSRQLATQSGSILDSNPDLASLLAVQAYRASPTTEATHSLYDAAAFPLRRTLTGHEASVTSVAYGSGGRALATGSEDGTARLWDTTTGRARVLTGHEGYVNAVALSPDGKLLATGSDDRTAKLWDTATGRLRTTLTGHLDDVDAVTFSPDGKTLATACDHGMLRLWDTTTYRIRARVGGQGHMNAVAFSPDGGTLALGSDNDKVRLWDWASGRMRILTGHGRTLQSVAFSPDGRTLASGSDDRTARLWDTATGRLRTTLSGHQGYVTSVAFSPDGHTLATGSQDRTVRLWDTATGQARALTGHQGAVKAVRFSPDGHTLATGGEDRTVRLWDPTAVRARTLTGHEESVQAVALSAATSTLATGGEDRTVRLWNPATGRLRHTLTGHGGAVRAVAFGRDGHVLATASDDRTVRLWDPATGRPLRTLTGHGGAVGAVAFSPDGRTLATGSEDRTVRLWDPATGRPLRTLAGHRGVVEAVAFGPDGRTLASGSEDRTVRLWDPATGRARVLDGHEGAVGAMAFSPDGRVLATGGADRTVRLWDPAAGRSRTTLTGHGDAVEAVAFSSDGRTLASGGDDGTARLWDVDLLNQAAAISRICEVVGRDLTPEERAAYLEGRSTKEVCPARQRGADSRRAPARS
ncbi:WD40 repeat domain-containing serine/threonine protein kinase [Streptomyces sp. CRN 30]|uniref:WD40 repeat domain-containing serine/threonine protein kinase n=1 Tax=Streptomyces sp. CRN 30 TaxID=3075613 RepID=UPI002A82B6EB|nr:protein kinase [Streptomyces sp. CRN 30]